MQNSTMNLVKSLEETLSFVSNENVKKDGDLLIVIQSFIQQFDVADVLENDDINSKRY